MGFSGKQKKEQLKVKREKKRQVAALQREKENKSNQWNDEEKEGASSAAELSLSSDAPHNLRPDEFMYGEDRRGVRSVFKKETEEEVEARKKLNYSPLTQRKMMKKEGIEHGDWFRGQQTAEQEDATLNYNFPFALPMPHRVWDQLGESKSNHLPPTCAEEIEREEEKYFERYLRALDNFSVSQALSAKSVTSSTTVNPPLNMYERNLDVWRQLWRTVEASEVVLLVADARYPILHLPISLLHYIALEEKKPCIIVLNKIDLIPTATLSRWEEFLQAYFEALGFTAPSPSANAGVREAAFPILIRSFTANPNSSVGGSKGGLDMDLNKRHKKEKKRAHLYEQLRTGKFNTRATMNENSGDKEPSDSDDSTCNFKGMEKMKREMKAGERDYKELKEVSEIIEGILRDCRSLAEAYRRSHRLNEVDPKDSCEESQDDEASLTSSYHIGVVGHPNAGKSSLLNCIRGTKVVSVSATAGHTKHLQTIPIPSEHITLLDSPGIVFPVCGIPRPLQAIIGTHQIAQTRDPQSCVRYLATHLPLERLFGLKRPEGSTDDEEWCAFDFCEAYAAKRGFFVKNGKGALDIHRASLAIIKEAFDGSVRLFFSPPKIDFLESAEFQKYVKPHLLLSLPAIGET